MGLPIINIEKLDGVNYDSLGIQIKVVLVQQDLRKILLDGWSRSNVEKNCET